MKKTLVIIGLAMSLSACNSLPKINVFQRNTPVAVPVNRPAPMNLGNVQWRVLNLDQMKSLIEENKNNSDVIFYVMDKGNYEVLSMNLTEMERYIKDQSAESKQLREAVAINAGKSK